MPFKPNELMLAGVAIILLCLLFLGSSPRRKNRRLSVAILLLLKNQAPAVEGLLRRICLVVAGSAGLNARLVAVDELSEDETVLILDRLERELPISVIRWDGNGASALQVGMRACPEPMVLVIRMQGDVDPRGVPEGILTICHLLSKINM